MPIAKSEYLSGVWKDNIFANKVIFCTGGAGSICSGQVRALVHLGANACIVGRNVEKTERVAAEIASCRPGSRVLGFGGVDVRSLASLEDAVARCVRELGSLDYAIAGAAGNFLASMDQLSANAFKSVMDIDVLGSYNMLKAVLPHLRKSAKAHVNDGKDNSTTRGTGGRIIFVSATLHYNGTPLQTHVMAAKAAVDALSAATAIEQGPRGITSNVIAPGPIANTEGMARLSRDDKGTVKKIPLGRMGEVREIADATVWLFSEAGSFVNGTNVVVDGGQWRIAQGSGAGFEYPDFLLSDAEVTGVAGGKKSRL